MFTKYFGRFFSLKTLIRVAVAALCLSGMAHAQSTENASARPSGNNYNFVAGGGG
jgi:hypothetical protein